MRAGLCTLLQPRQRHQPWHEALGNGRRVRGWHQGQARQYITWRLRRTFNRVQPYNTQTQHLMVTHNMLMTWRVHNWASAGAHMRSSLLNANGRAACFCRQTSSAHTSRSYAHTSKETFNKRASLPRHLQQGHPGAPGGRCRPHSRWCHPCPHGSLQRSGCAAGRSCMKANVTHSALISESG